MNNKELCSTVVPTQTNSPRLQKIAGAGGSKTFGKNHSLLESNSSAGASRSAGTATTTTGGELSNIIARMDDGISIMNSEGAGGLGQNIFVIGMTGAGKSTVTLLLTSYSSLYSCKRSANEIQYVIRDVKQVISTVDSSSKTKIPEIIHSPLLQTTIYDCPGFSDTNPQDELTNAYFIKHALDGSKRAKFLLVAPFKNLQTAGDRHYFGNLLLHTVKTIKNIEKYRESFALAVTFASPFHLPEVIVNSVAAFLTTFLDEELDTKFECQGEILNRAKALVDSLLAQDDDGSYVAIGIFRSPTQHGPLSDIVSTQQDRQRLLMVLTDGTFYTDTDPQDFGYSVSDGGKLRAAGLRDIIHNQISENMNQFWADIQYRFQTQLYQLLDPVGNHSTIEETLGVLRSVKPFFQRRHGGTPSGVIGPKEFVVSLMSSMAPLRLDLPRNPTLSSILLQGSHVKFVENLVTESNATKLDSGDWLKGLEPLVKLFEVYARWTSTLIQLEKNLATYQIQSASYAFPEFRNESGTIHATAENIQLFISSPAVPEKLQLIKAALAPFVDVGSHGRRVVNFHQLNPILEYFTSQHSCKSTAAEVRIEGHFVLASSVVSNPDSCISAATKRVVIYAWETFFLDATIDAKSITGNDTFDLVILANKLESFGQKISLTGRDAENQVRPVVARDRDGMNGLTGLKGGDTLGLFRETSGLVSVEINGGKGGNGQDGEDGYDGRNGTACSVDLLHGVTVRISDWAGFFQNYPDRCYLDRIPPGLRYELVRGDAVGKCSAFIPATQNKYHYYFYGDAGQPGGKGGNGGMAGRGGEPGVGKIHEMVGNHLMSRVAVAMDCGPMGLPGARGKGGDGGSNSSCTVCLDEEGGDSHCALASGHSTSHYTAPKGNSGRVGALPVQCPPRRVFSAHTYTPDITNYKKALRAQLVSPSGNRRLLPFLLSLNSNNGVDREFFTTKSLLADLAELENQLPSLLEQPGVPLSVLYDASLNRTANMLVDSQSEEERAILRHAASAIYGRLAVFSKKTAQSNLITDLEGYIDLTDQMLAKLKTMESNSNAVAQITATKDKFNEFIQSRIKEVEDLTEQVIQPEISRIQDQLKKAMDAILRQLMEDRQKAITNRNQLYTEQLKDTMMLGKVFGFLKLGAQALSFLGPVGAIAGAVVSTASSVAQSSIPGDSGPSSAGLASDLQDKALSWHFESKKQKLEDQKSQLRDLKTKFEGIPAQEDTGSAWTQEFQVSKKQVDLALNRVDGLKDQVKKVQDLGSPGGGASESSESLEQEIASIKTDVKNGLEDMEKTLTAEAEQKKDDELEAKKLLDTTKKLLSIVNTAAELYKLFKQDDNKVAELAKAEKVLAAYDSKVRTAESRMPQILNRLEKITAGAFKSARNHSSSGAVLDVSSWQLQSTLDDVGLEIEIQIVSGAPIDAQVKIAMDKLKEAFRTLFKICDRIQDYVTEQRMASFISDSLLSTVEAAQVQRDLELHRNLQKLKLVSGSNLVLQYWKNIETSFRMYVFPYANIYLSQISLLQGEHDLLLLPHTLTDLPTLVDEISRRTVEMKAKLATFRTTIVPELHTNEHVGGFDLANPLYTWGAEEVKSLLPDLLTGRPISLIADIRKSPVSLDAIKFNGIHVHLIHEDSMINSTLQSALSNFKLKMTHGGMNHYRFDGKHYGVYSEPLSLRVSYQVGPSQHKNKNYVKLGQGPPLLSPYTLWTFRLYSDVDGATMDGLRGFVGQDISLVLTGHGTYVTDSTGQSATRQVERFYKSVQL